jgi:hypothetical protein
MAAKSWSRIRLRTSVAPNRPHAARQLLEQHVAHLPAQQVRDDIHAVGVDMEGIHSVFARVPP